MDLETEKIVSIADIAIEKFKSMLLDAGNKDLFLRLSIELEGMKMYYNIDTAENPFEGDKIYNYDDLKVLINYEDEELLKGTSIDYIIDDFGETFVIENPNTIKDIDDDGGCCGRGCCCGH